MILARSHQWVGIFALDADDFIGKIERFQSKQKFEIEIPLEFFSHFACYQNEMQIELIIRIVKKLTEAVAHEIGQAGVKLLPNLFPLQVAAALRLHTFQLDHEPMKLAIGAPLNNQTIR